MFCVIAYPCASTSVLLTYVWAFGFVGCILFSSTRSRRCPIINVAFHMAYHGISIDFGIFSRSDPLQLRGTAQRVRIWGSSSSIATQASGCHIDISSDLMSFLNSWQWFFVDKSHWDLLWKNVSCHSSFVAFSNLWNVMSRGPTNRGPGGLGPGGIGPMSWCFWLSSLSKWAYYWVWILVNS